MDRIKIVHAVTRQALRVFLDKHFCGCGNPGAAIEFLLGVLRAMNLRDAKGDIDWHNRGDALKKLLPEPGIEYFVLYWLAEHGLSEHGGSVPGWLTPLGEGILTALEGEKKADDFESLMRQACAHGFEIEDPHHDCSEYEANQVEERVEDVRERIHRMLPSCETTLEVSGNDIVVKISGRAPKHRGAN